jgi:hypothetical protein
MTLLDAKQYDFRRDSRRRNVIIIAVLAVIVLCWAAYHCRDYPQRHAVGKFFAAIQKQDYESAYAVWFNDPDWRQHPGKYSNYAYSEFYQDWGPGGEWGLVKKFSVDCSLGPGNSNGVIVQTTVNGRAEPAYLWVDKQDKTIHPSPSEIQCGNWFGWLTE